MKITKNQAQELIHKFNVLADTEDLMEDYGITPAQAAALVASVPHNGGDWICPADCLDAAKGELADHAIVLRDIADSIRHQSIGQSLACSRDSIKMDEISESLN